MEQGGTGGGKRARRFRFERVHSSSSHSMLPLRSPHYHHPLTHTISCWYCDLKTRALNEPLFRLGRRHATCFRVWFSIGVGFSLTTLLLASFILLLGLGRALHLFRFNSDRVTALLFGFLPSNLSLSDAAYVFFSTLISVAVHEFGHAVAAASEGIQLEYIAIFVATLFPGALIAFNHDQLEALPQFTALRIYCAGIWHNAVFCAVCGLALCFLPFILFPFYIHGERPLVLDVPSRSPLFGYLSAGDVVMSMDGIQIRNPKEWIEVAARLHRHTLQRSNDSIYVESFRGIHDRKGYCVPNSKMEQSDGMQLANNQFACPNDLTAFVTINCLESMSSDDITSEDGQSTRRESGLCFNANDIVKHNKCGDEWVSGITNGSSCTCPEGESCLSPVQWPGITWTEIMYSSPHSPGCLKLQRNSLSADSETYNSMGHNCGGTFVFVGHLISMAHSVHLTAYRPRWTFACGSHLPDILERSLTCTFHVSLTLALLNSLPVYFLDGESILEVTLCHFAFLSPRRRRGILRVCLIGGTILAILSILRIFVVSFM